MIIDRPSQSFAILLAAPLVAIAIAGTTSTAHAAGQGPLIVGTVDTSRYPDAVCNDGEAATFNYVLTRDTGPGADGVDHRRKWLVVLSGGGACTDEESCSRRWREVPGSGVFDDGPGDHGNMVADHVARPFDGKGLLDFDGQPSAGGGFVVGATANPFRGSNGTDGFNRLWINYCSSDTWAGLGETVEVPAADYPGLPSDTGDPTHGTLHFGGAKIVDAVIATIMRGELRDDLGNLRPDLAPDSATGELVLAGSSAGGVGTIRNLDTVARDVHAGTADFAAAPGVVVWGVPDAGTWVGPLVTASGVDAYATAAFYGDGDATAVRTDDGCVDDPITHVCYSIGDHVVANEITTPYFVVQQAYDQQIHGPIADGLAALIRTDLAYVRRTYPRLYAYATAIGATPDDAAIAYIRHTITDAAPSIGLARGNPAGLFIPNYATGWHQLVVDSQRFFTSEAAQWPAVGDPRLGTGYAGTTVSIPTALGRFRRCVLGNYAPAADYAGCVSTIDLVIVATNARVVNDTAP